MDEKIWHEERVTLKEDKVIVKLKNPDDSFKKSIIIPTNMYPLNGKYEVFTHENTEMILNSDQNEELLSIFDSVKYKIGHCYSNTKELTEKLKKKGFDAKSYVGWLFTEVYEYPIHHCWVVINGKSVLDLADDFSVMLSSDNAKHFENKSRAEVSELIADFKSQAMKVPNRIRCSPVGKPTPFLFYVGCECDPEEGRKIYNKLMSAYPGHECERNCDASGLNPLQKKMKEMGLM